MLKGMADNQVKEAVEEIKKQEGPKYWQGKCLLCESLRANLFTTHLLVMKEGEERLTFGVCANCDPKDPKLVHEKLCESERSFREAHGHTKENAWEFKTPVEVVKHEK